MIPSFVLQGTLSSAGMAPVKPRQVDRVAAAFDDDHSIIDLPTFAKAKKGRKADADREKTTKRTKLLVSEKHRGVEVPPLRPVKEPAKLKEAANVTDAGKSRVYRESVHVTQEMLDNQLLGFDRLDLSVDLGDYGEPRFYTGSSSSGEMGPRKERSYRLARALGVSSNANLACGFNLNELGFAEYCYCSHLLPEVEWDLLQVDGSALAEAASYHAIGVRFYFARASFLFAAIRCFYLIRRLPLTCFVVAPDGTWFGQPRTSSSPVIGA